MTSHKKPTPRDRSLAFPTVRFWQGQLNASGIRHYPNVHVGTKSVVRAKVIRSPLVNNSANW